MERRGSLSGLICTLVIKYVDSWFKILSATMRRCEYKMKLLISP